MLNQHHFRFYQELSNNYLGGFRVSSNILEKKNLSGGYINISIDAKDMSNLIEILKKEKINVDRENSQMVIGSNEKERLIPFDPKAISCFLLNGYSLITDKNLKINIRDSYEVVNILPPISPPILIASIKKGITGTFYSLSSKKPSHSLIDCVEGIFKDYYSKRFKGL